MLFRQLFDATSSTYTYLIGDAGTRQAVLIDPVFEQRTRDLALLRELDLTLRYTLETHVHADHVTAAWLLQQATGSQIVVSAVAGVSGADVLVADGDVIRFGDTALHVRATPGHTCGCITLVTADQRMAFTGDALLIRGAGRTDFQQGDPHALFRSISELFTLPDDCVVYPAHDYAGRTASTIREEKAFNPRAGGSANERDFVGYMQNLQLPHPKKMDSAVPANLQVGRPEGGEVPATASWGPVVVTYAGIPEIDPTWVAEHPSAVTVLDVREPDELTGPDKRIADAHNVPLGQLRQRIDEVPTTRPVIAVCRSGRRSAQATVILRAAGHDCANLAGGMLGWNLLRLPVV